MSGYPQMGEIILGYEGLDMPILFTQKGLIHLQRKVTGISHAEEERLERQGMDEKEIERKTTVIERVITMEWMGANPHVELIKENRLPDYHGYGLLTEKAYGYQKIIYKNLYAGIDLEYTFTNDKKAGFEYRLLVQPGADLTAVKMKFGGDVKKIKLKGNGSLVIESDINGIEETIPISYYGHGSSNQNVGEVASAYSLTDREIGFTFPNGYDSTKAMVIDPFVTATSNLVGANAGKAKDVDFDYAGNIYITGGGGGAAHMLAKYNSAGVLQWTYSGTQNNPSWSFGPYYGGWVVEKPTGNVYLGQGFNFAKGFIVIRINTNGLYDNYITNGNPNFRENWKMIWNCNSGSAQIIVAGGGTNSNINLGLLSPPSVNPTAANITGIPSIAFQDMADMVIDPVTNSMYTLYASGSVATLNNSIYKHNQPYSAGTIVWNVPTGYSVMDEANNRPYLVNGGFPGYQDNSINTLALNANFLFYWDGKNLKAFDKATGNAAGTALTVAANTAKMQCGIAVDACNNVYVGEANGLIKVYKFTGTVFDDAAAADISIPGFATKAVYDLAYNETQKLLYASGDGFVFSYDVSTYCPSTQYTLNTVPNCLTASVTASLSPTPPLGSTVTYVVYNGTNFIATNNTGIFTGLQPNVNYTIVATINLACSGSQLTGNFIIPGPTVNITQTSATCGASTGTITATGSGTAGPYTYNINGGAFQGNGNFTGLAAGIYTIIVKDAGGCPNTATVTILNSNGPAVSFVQTNADCGSNAGTVTATVTGGTAPYQYSINNGVVYQSNNFFTGLVAGQYILVVKDATGCTNSSIVNITSTPSPSLTATPAAATCGKNNGNITAFGTGGTGALEYSIDGNHFQTSSFFPNLNPGTYTVTVKDANGCIKSTTVIVGNTPAPSVTATSTTASCANLNGSITATGTGGIPPLQYTINNGFYQSNNVFTNLAAGVYTVSVQDFSGCISSVSVTIGSTGGPTVTAVSSSSACGTANGSITATATGGTPPYTYSANGGSSYQASNIFTGLPAFNYIIYAKDANGCIAAYPVVVGNTAGPTVTASITPTSCSTNDGVITATGNVGTAPYQYSIDGITYTPSNVFPGLGIGIYTVYVKDANGCTSNTTITLNNVAGLTLAVSTISSSCNTNNGVINAISTGGVAPLQYSINGTNYFATNVFNGLSPGNYIVYAKDANGCIVSKPTVLQSVTGPSVVSATTPLNATCASSNGVIVVTGTGGLAPLTYSINGTVYQASNTFINVAPGSYTVYVKDATGCTASQSPVTITNTGAGPGISTFTVVTKYYPCDGDVAGKITNPRVNGANCATCTFSLDFGPYIPNSTQLFLNVPPGIHYVTAKDANGCTKTIQANLVATPLSTGTTVITGTACNTSNGSIALTGIGPNTPYHASINGGTTWVSFNTTTTFTGLAAGTYTIIMADDASFTTPPDNPGGCTTTLSVIVPSTGGPTLTTTFTDGTCLLNDGTITAVGIGSAPLTYNINGGAYQSSGLFTGLASGVYNINVKDGTGCITSKLVTITNPTAPTVAVSTLGTSCNLNNGSITITGTGGTAPYTYSIDGATFQSSNFFANLAVGTYYAHVKDVNGCYNFVTVNLSAIALPQVTAFSLPATCNNNDGGIITSGNFGTAPYTYSIDGTVFQSSNSFTGLAAGFYTVTIKDARACTNTTGITIGNIGAATFTTVVVPAKCGLQNGSITMTATGGTAPYQYSSDGGVTYQTNNILSPLLSGTYIVFVKDANGCKTSRAILVNNVNGPQALTTVVVHAACGLNNGSITATVTGGTLPLQYSINGTTFQLSNVFTAVGANSYTLTVRDANNCIFSIPVDVQNLAGPSLTATSSSASCNANDGTITAIAVGGTGVLSYSKNGITFQTSNIFTGLAAGPYTITVKDARNCISTFSINVTSFAGATVSAVTVGATCGASNGTITATGFGGATPYQYSINGTTFQTSNVFNALAAGPYTVTIKDANNCIGSTSVSISSTTGASVSAFSTNATCGATNGTITATGTGGATPYQYSINGTIFQASNVFNALAAGPYTVTIKDANNCTNTFLTNVGSTSGATVTATSIAASCGSNNGSITAIGLGGLLPYQYSLDGTTFQVSNVFNALAAGPYTVTIKDANNCTNNFAISIGSTAGATVTAVAASATCGASNGTITATGTGGTTPYQYSINGTTFQASNIFNALAAGPYTVTIKDANNCQNTFAISIGSTSGATVTATSVSATCGASNGTITATGIGGATPYQYSINGTTFQASNVFNALAAGPYTVTIKDANNCQNTFAISIGSTSGATVTATSVSATCGASNGTITATGTGGTTPYQYSINGTTFQSSNVFNALAAGPYTVTIKDANNCTNTFAISIGSTAGATVTAVATSATCGAGNGTITATGVGGTTPYQYSINGTTFQTSNVFNALAAGPYTVTIKDANNCTNTFAISIGSTAGATVTAAATSATCGASNGTITATGTGGTTPYQYSIDGTTFQASNVFNALAAGPYTVTIKDANNCQSTFAISIGSTSGATVTATSVAATCGANNGTITATGVGGTSPYLFSINGINFQTNNVFTGLSPNTYTITIKDANSCTNTTSAIITNVNGATVTAVSTNATCGASNGTIAATGIAGTTPYQYSIDGTTFQASNVFNALAAGPYTVTIKDANNCINTTTIAIANTNAVSVTSATIASTCGNANGTITATGVGGALPYQFSIDGTTFQSSNIFNNLAANTYTVTIKDANNCVNTTNAIISNANGASVTALATNTTCGNANGTITATGTGGTTPYQYSINGTTFQASNTFSSLAANNYTVTIKDANNCTNTFAIVVNSSVGPTISATSTNSTCGNANGIITANGTSGIPPYQYSIDGTTFQASNIFNALAAGPYTVTIKDAANCTNTFSISITNTSGATVTAITSNASCGNANGSITATGTGGTSPYQYSINGTTFQNSNIFNGLLAGPYTVTIKDANNCTSITNISINNTGGATVTATSSNASCGNNNGSITATGVGGSSPYQYSINGTTFQTSNVFNALTAGPYTVTIKDANNCTNTTSITINSTNGATVTATPTNAACGSSNGSITATGIGGTSPYQYSIDGTTFQTSNTFSALAAGSYTVTIKDANNCTNTTSVTISSTNGATVTATSIAAACGASNGSIITTGTGGATPYQYSIDGTIFQTSNIFNALAAGSYTVTIKDANNCTNTFAIVIASTSGATVTATATAATCGASNGSITATGIGGTTPYQYSINGTTFQASNVFNALAAGSYTVTIKDANNCTSTFAISIGSTAGAAVTAVSTNASCGASNGTITATGAGGTSPYQYSIDGTTFQASNIFNSLSSGSYTVTIKDANNCTNTVNVVISNISGATVSAIATNATCGASNGSITATGTGGVSPYQYAIDGTTFQTSNVFNGLTANIYTVTIKDANNCTNTTTAVINTSNGATLTASATNTTCGNANGTITATGSNGTTPYQYSIDGTIFQTSNTFNGLTANNYTVTIKDANNCTSTTQVVISNIAGANVIANTTASTCGNANGVITANGSGGATPYQYSIDGTTFQSSNVFSGLAANTYTITIKDANNCLNTTSVSITNTAGATVSTIGTNATCGNANGSITATGTGGATPYLYSINGTSFQTSNLFNGLAANNYTITIKDANSCTNTSTITISSINGATVSATATNASCGANNGSITATGAGGTTPYQYSIDGTTFQTSNTFNGLAPNNYTITIKDANNCTSITTATIVVTNGVTVNASSTSATCGNSNGSITATAVGGTSPYQYSIDGTIFQASNVFNGLAAGPYTVTIKDVNNCTSTTPITISNANAALVTAASTNATCGTSNGTITATGTGGATPYQYSIDGTNFQASNTFNGLAANTYTVTIKDANNCTNTTSTTITTTSPPSLTATATNSTCGNVNGSITAIGTGGVAPYQYSIDGITFQTSNIFNGLAANTYIVTIKDVNNCANTFSIQLSNIAGATVTAISSNTSCGNSNGSITATGIGGTSPYQYSINGTTFQTSNVFNGLAANNYTVTIKDANNCTSTTTTTVTTTNGATVTAVSTNASCNTSNGSITATGVGGTTPYQYSIDGTIFQTSNVFTALAAGSYTVTIKDANNCTNTTSIAINSTNGATVTATSVAAACGASNGSITATGVGGTTPYQYSIDGTTFQTSNVFNGLAAGSYTVTIKDANNCTNTFAISVSSTNGTTVTATSIAAACGANNGSITATGAGGATPYQYSINGTTFQTSNIFNGLAAGSYTVTIKDANNCTNTTSIAITSTNGATVTATSIAAACGANNGSITATGVGGTTPYQYSIDGTIFQTSNIFNGLAAGSYTVTIKDANNCTNTTSIAISSTNGATVTATSIAAACGVSNGSITATGVGGTTPYQYSINGTTFQASNIFNGLAAGPYTVTIKDANNCTNTTSIAISSTNGATVTATSIAAACGASNGSITATGIGGTTPYQYSIDGTIFQASNIFNGLAAGPYTVTIKDANNCTNTTSIAISSTSGATVTATSIAAACGANNGSITATGVGGSTPYQYSINGTTFQASNIFNGLAAGPYTVTIKDANNCTNTTSIAISSTNGATVTATSIAASCGSSNGSITATGAGGATPYQYSINGTTFQTSNVFNGLAANNYTITIKDANNCTNTTTTTVTTTNGATVTAVSTNASCNTNNGSITATGTGGTTPYQYSINGTTFQTSNIFNGLAANNYTVTIKDANNCTSTTTVTVSTTNGASVSATSSNATCGNNNGSITATGNGGATPYQYSINGTTFQTSNVFNGLIANTYTITIKDANNCTNTTTAIITNIAGANISATFTNATCGNNNGSITATGTGGTSPYQYSINGTNFQTSNIFSGLATNTYTITIKDANNCTNTTTATITNIAGATVSSTFTNATCGSNNGSINATGTGGTTPYQYSINGTTFQTSNIFNGLAANTYTITIKDANNCTSTTTATITSIGGASVVATANNSTCGNNNGSINAAGTGGTAPYQYSINGTTFQTSNQFSNLSPNTYTVTIKDANNCTNTTTVNIINIPGATVTATNTQADCQTNNGTVTATAVGGTAPYQFSIDGGAYQSNNLFTGLAAGQHTINIKDANNCISSTTSIITVNNPVVINAGADIIICQGASKQINATANTTNIVWTPTRGLSNPNIINPIVSITTNQTYIVTATIGQCTKTDTINVNVNPLPIANAGPDAKLCFGTGHQLNGSGSINYQWTPPNFLSNPNIANPNISTSATGRLTYFLSVTDANGCKSQKPDTVVVTIIPKPKVFAGNDTSIVANQPLQLNAIDVSNSGFNSFVWSPGFGLNNPNAQNPIAITDRDRTYTVIARNTTYGCEAKDEINVKVFSEADIFVPTAFTPNKDGLNDVIRPILIGIKELKYFIVFNRYGQQVFNTKIHGAGWDGNINGELQNSSLYVWIVEGVAYNGKVITKKGTTLLIR